MPRKPKRRSWGSIRSVSRDKHVIRWIENTPQGRVRKCHTFHGTAAEASLWLDRKHVECADNGDRPVPTIGDVCRMWWRPAIERKLEAGKLKPRTVKIYERSWRMSEGRWSKVPVTQVHPKDVQEWLMTMTEGDARNALKVLKGVMDFAVKYEVADSNKFRIGYELPPKAYTRDKSVLTLEQAKETLASLKGMTLEGAFIIACFGGARSGEALAVRADEIRPAEYYGVRLAMVPITRTAGDESGSIMDSTKTEDSSRTAVVPEPYCDRLLEVAAKGGWIADRGDGIPFGRSQLWTAWRSQAPGSVPFANLRPSWRTFAELRWKVPHDTLELLMGHRLPGVTGRHYMRPDDEELARSFAEAYASFGKIR